MSGVTSSATFSQYTPTKQERLLIGRCFCILWQKIIIYKGLTHSDAENVFEDLSNTKAEGEKNLEKQNTIKHPIKKRLSLQYRKKTVFCYLFLFMFFAFRSVPNASRFFCFLFLSCFMYFIGNDCNTGAFKVKQCIIDKFLFVGACVGFNKSFDISVIKNYRLT